MPQPTLATVHVDRPLTNLSIAFLQQDDKFVAAKVFPRVPVAKQSDLFFTFAREDFNRIVMEKRGLSSPSAGSGFGISTDSYFADLWSLHKDIDDRIRANSDQPLSPDRNATQFLTIQAKLRLEKEWNGAFFTTGVWSSDVTPGTLWSAAASTPFDDILAENETIEEATGFTPNKFVMGAQVWRVLQNHPDFVDRVTGIGGRDLPAKVMLQALAELLELEEVMVARAVENTAAEGAAEVSAYLNSKVDALLVYANPAPAIEMPSGGYTFWWTGLIGGAEGQRIKSFRMDPLMSDRIEIDQAFDQKLISSELGVFFDNVVS